MHLEHLKKIIYFASHDLGYNVVKIKYSIVKIRMFILYIYINKNDNIDINQCSDLRIYIQYILLVFFNLQNSEIKIFSYNTNNPDLKISMKYIYHKINKQITIYIKTKKIYHGVIKYIRGMFLCLVYQNSNYVTINFNDIIIIL